MSVNECSFGYLCTDYLKKKTLRSGSQSGPSLGCSPDNKLGTLRGVALNYQTVAMDPFK